MNRKNIKSKIDTLKCYFIDIGNALLRAVRKNEIAPDWCVMRLLLVIICTGIGVLGFPRLNVPAAVADNGTGSPSIEVMPNEGTIGGQIYLKIINYQPNKDIIVTFGSGTIIGAGTSVGTQTVVAAKATTDASGYAVANWDLDVFPAGRYIIMADDGVNKLTTGFKVDPSIDLGNVVSGFVNDIIVVNGKGFSAQELVYIGLDDQKIVTTQTDDKGQFYDAKLQIPPTVRGNHNIKVQDTDDNIATAVFNVRQQMTVMPANAAVGDNVTIIGTGFQGVTDVLVYFDDKDAGIVQTDSNGGFMTSIKVPACGDGGHQIKLDDRINKAYKDVSVSSSLSVNPNNGFIGMQVGLQGSGFRPGFPVTISYDNVKLDPTTVQENGSFTQTFKVPVSHSGTHTISATDGINTQNTIFIVSSTPPLAPETTLPAEGSRVTKDAHFEWGVVTDPSGVSYTIEVAGDPKFTNVIMSQANLLTNYIDVTDDSKLLPGRDAPYYWRVKAVDRASNESAWSPVSSFYKGHTLITILTNMPDWVKYVLICLGLVLFGFMFFWIGHTIKRLRNLDDEDVDDEGAYAGNQYSYNSGGNDWKQR
ncbi:MAG: hypothetical protein ABSG90_08190 [Dehalococcoidia bacterium]|jgi:hypothetical protein